ncbi:hypothetical protein ACMD2_26289 [Ananas comosus]|uniref:Uncharacterized protein n=1 Tax=Ananas comosus TaxID=4615 RepID=A0A199V1S8_ANACO|nr:hypothetical protein ACMD2_26289 [Ananas comosus]
MSMNAPPGWDQLLNAQHLHLFLALFYSKDEWCNFYAVLVLFDNPLFWMWTM